MAKKKNVESDSTYLLKLVLFLILGSQWLRIENFPDWSIPIPLGLIIGVFFASHDHFKIDRKIGTIKIKRSITADDFKISTQKEDGEADLNVLEISGSGWVKNWIKYRNFLH